MLPSFHAYMCVCVYHSLTQRCPAADETVSELSPAAVVLQQSDQGGGRAGGLAQLTQLRHTLAVLPQSARQPVTQGQTHTWWETGGHLAETQRYEHLMCPTWAALWPCRSSSSHSRTCGHRRPRRRTGRRRPERRTQYCTQWHLEGRAGRQEACDRFQCLLRFDRCCKLPFSSGYLSNQPGSESFCLPDGQTCHRWTDPENENDDPARPDGEDVDKGYSSWGEKHSNLNKL